MWAPPPPPPFAESPQCCHSIVQDFVCVWGGGYCRCTRGTPACIGTASDSRFPPDLNGIKSSWICICLWDVACAVHSGVNMCTYC